MPLFPQAPLQEIIVRELSQGPREAMILWKLLQKHGTSVTKQGMYKALRALRAEEIVFLQAGEASLNIRWLQQLERFITVSQEAYTNSTTGSGNILLLHDGERISYTFKTALQVDAFWNHLLYLILEARPNIRHWFAYASHHWFLLAHRHDELALMRFMKSHTCKYLFTVGHHLPLDRSIINDFDGEHAQYHMRDTPLFTRKKNPLGLVLNILGDYIISTEYAPVITERIEQFYKTHKILDKISLQELKTIVSTPSRTTLTIKRDARKADKLTSSLGKTFYLGTKKTN